MPGKFKLFKIITSLIGLIFLSLIVDYYLISQPLPHMAFATDAEGSQSYLVTYPFRTYLDQPFFDFYPEEGWSVSHPVGLGDKVPSRIVLQNTKSGELYIRFLNNFASGYKHEVEWIGLKKDKEGFLLDDITSRKYIQFKIKTGSNEKLSDISPVITFDSEKKAGLPALFSIELDRYYSNTNDSSQEQDFEPINPAINEYPVQTVFLDDTFETYFYINNYYSAGFILAGDIDLSKILKMDLNDIIERYSGYIKIWRLSNINTVIREQAAGIIASIRKNCDDAVILWNKSGFPAAPAEDVVVDVSPIKLNRGFLWTLIIIFTLFFTSIGTLRIFKVPLSFRFSDLKMNLFEYYVCAFIFIFPFIFLKSGTDEGILKMVLISSVSCFFIEFLRVLTIISLGSMASFFRLRKRDEAREMIINIVRKRIEPTRIDPWKVITLVVSSILIAMLFAGYPGVSLSIQVILVIQNLLCGLILGVLFMRYRSFGMNFVFHFLALLPSIIFAGGM